MGNVHTIDLNLIRIFNAVLDEGGVTRAAARLHMTQSAVSHALARLRVLVGDELFIRGPDGMHPTPRATELAQSFGPALRQIEMAICEPVFDPESSELEFSISTSDYVTSTVLADFMRRQQRVAPHTRCRIRSLGDVNVTEELDRGSIHVAIGVFGKTPGRFIIEPLFSDRNVWLMRKGHPVTAGEFGLRELASCTQVDILISDRAAGSGPVGTIDQGGLERAHITSNPTHIEAIFAAHGHKRKIGATVPHILVVPSLVAATDMIAFVPLRFALHAAGIFDLDWREPPYETVPLEISMLSHRTMGAHPAVRWLRRELSESAATSQFS